MVVQKSVFHVRVGKETLSVSETFIHSFEYIRIVFLKTFKEVSQLFQLGGRGGKYLLLF